MEIIVAWFYYSAYYMLFSIVITLVINRLVQRLYLAPLIINGISAVVLWSLIATGHLSGSEGSYALYFNFMPVVMASIATNGCIALWRWHNRRENL